MLLISSLLIVMAIQGQTFKHCNIYQFEGRDSLKKSLVLKETFNSFGKILSEEYKNYKEDRAKGTEDTRYYYFYNDTLLIRRTCIYSSSFEKGDSEKTIYSYNDKKLLIKEEHYDFKRRAKKNLPPK